MTPMPTSSSWRAPSTSCRQAPTPHPFLPLSLSLHVSNANQLGSCPFLQGGGGYSIVIAGLVHELGGSVLHEYTGPG